MMRIEYVFNLLRKQKWSKNKNKKLVEINIFNVRFEAFTAVTMKNAVFWNVTYLSIT
jgi:hypothetical protein